MTTISAVTTTKYRVVVEDGGTVRIIGDVTSALSAALSATDAATSATAAATSATASAASATTSASSATDAATSATAAAASADEAQAAWTAALAANPDLNPAVRMNPSTISVATTIPSYYNAYSAGPLTIGENIEVTLNDNSNWSIL